MYRNRRITDAAQVIELIDFSQYGDADVFVPPNEDDTGVVGDRPSLSNLSAQFLLHLSRYLRGSGHPDHPIINGIVPREDRIKVQDDPGFRSRHFLLQVSGLEVLPFQPSVIEVSISPCLTFSRCSHNTQCSQLKFTRGLPRSHSHRQPVCLRSAHCSILPFTTLANVPGGPSTPLLSLLLLECRRSPHRGVGQVNRGSHHRQQS